MSTAVTADDPAFPEATAPTVKKKRPNIGLIVVAVVVVGLGAFGTQRYLYGRNHVVTDNAQVEGHIVPVLARVTGYVTAVNASENQNVKAGDVLVEIDDR